MPDVEKQKPKGLLFSAAAIALAGIGAIFFNSATLDPHIYSTNLYTVLGCYGFTKPTQKTAILFLMQQAGIKDAKELLEKNTRDKDELAALILRLVRETQAAFFQRQGKQERWEVKTSDWMQNPATQQQIIDALRVLGITQESKPTFESRDAVCILGATKPTMEQRFTYAADLYTKQQLNSRWLVLVTGERIVKIDSGSDGTEAELRKIAFDLKKSPEQLTETDLMKLVYDNSTLHNAYPNLHIVDTKKTAQGRPTTETTVVDFCQWIKQNPDHGIMHITFVSNQPNVEYQKAIITYVFAKQGVDIPFEVIGPKYTTTNKPIEKQINELVQALGSIIFAKTPQVLQKLEIDLSDPVIRDAYKTEFDKNPLVYQSMLADIPRPIVRI